MLGSFIAGFDEWAPATEGKFRSRLRGKEWVAIKYTPTSRDTRNRALASLPTADFDHLIPDIRVMKLARGEVLHHQDGKVGVVYFPLSGMISTIVTLEDGRAVEAAMTGSEGMLDVAALGTGSTFGEHLVQGDGEAITIRADHLFKAMQGRPHITRMVCLAAELASAYSLRSMACRSFHQIEARFCRSLLMARYHSRSDDLELTHEFLAAMLGVQRSSVTMVAKTFLDRGVITYRRGQISILDVAGLEESSCTCYEYVVARIEATFR